MITGSKIKYVILFLLSFKVWLARAQSDKSFDFDASKYVEYAGERYDMDLNAFLEKIRFYFSSPLNINKCDADELLDLEILSEPQVASILQYRQNHGPFISEYELQAVPLLDLNTVRLLFPLVTTGGNKGNYHVALDKMLVDSKKDIYLKSKFTLEEKNGYLASDNQEPRYAGNKYSYYTKIKLHYENRFRASFTGETDAGENFFAGNNHYGFDFNSFHIFLYKYKHWLKEFNIGDYTVSFGQGLITHNDFVRGKSALVTNIKKNTSKTIKPYNSIDENNFFRGTGATLVLSDNIELTLFGSYHKIDGTLSHPVEEPLGIFTSSISSAGLHRTDKEIASKHSVKQAAAGGKINYKVKNGHIAFNSLYIHLDKPLKTRQYLYNKFKFQGKELLNASIDYSYLYKNILFSGEFAGSKNNAYALLQALQFIPSPKTGIALLYRRYSKSYQSLYSNSFGESQGTNNEEGLYLGLTLNPGGHWHLSFYHDVWRFPWMKYNITAPSDGSEFFALAKYTRRHRYEFYIQYKQENKGKDIRAGRRSINATHKYLKRRLRFHLEYKVNSDVILRNRIEFSYFNFTGSGERGILIYQDILYKPLRFPLSVVLRYAIFQTGSFASAIYAYENDILGENYIPAYYGKGYRTYLTLRYRPRRNLVLEGRWSRWFLPDATSIGSGYEQINANHKTDIKLQVKYSFN